MKRVIVLLLWICTTTLCFSETFYHDGISFEYGKGWRFYPSKTEKGMVLGFYRENEKIVNFQKSIADYEGSFEGYTEIFFEKLEENEGIISKSQIINGTVNGNEAKFVDIVYSNKVCQRVYLFEKKGYVIWIVLSQRGKKIGSGFSKILDTFKFNPE